MSDISIVVPFLNEEEGIEMFCGVLDAYFGEEKDIKSEIIFVDDGSEDNTVEKLLNYKFININKVKLVRLSKNFGSHAAIRAGVQEATAKICTWMGSDLQEPIEFLAQAMEKIAQGNDAVYIEKEDIKVSRTNRGFSKIYSRLMQKYAVKNYASGGISNIVFNEKIKNYLNANVELNSSIMLQIIETGFRYETISLKYNERAAGTSKWTMRKKIKLFIDSFVSFSFMPIRLVSITGITMFVLGLLFGFWIIIVRIFGSDMPQTGYATIASLLAVGFGITNISLGIIAEYLWRAYDAARNRPAYIVSETIQLVE